MVAIFDFNTLEQALRSVGGGGLQLLRLIKRPTRDLDLVAKNDDGAVASYRLHLGSHYFNIN